MSNEVRLGRSCQAKPPHLSAPEISHCLFVHGCGVAPRSRPDPGYLWAPSDCIPDPPHSPPVPPFTILQMAYPSPVHTSPGRLSLKPLSQATSVAFGHQCLAACERRTLFSIGFDLRACSLSPSLLLCSTTVVILVLLRNTLRSERIGRSYVNPNVSPTIGGIDKAYLHPTNRHYTRHSTRSASLLASYQSFVSVSLRLWPSSVPISIRLPLDLAYHYISHYSPTGRLVASTS